MNSSVKNNVESNSLISIHLIDYSVLGEIREFIKNELQNHGLNEIEIQKIIVAIDEICTNLIKHALGYKTFEQNKNKYPNSDNSADIYASDSNFNKVELGLEIFDNKLIIKISDITKSFNILDMPDTNMSNYFKLFKSGGLGIKLVKLIMDEIEYIPANEYVNQNTLILTKYLIR